MLDAETVREIDQAAKEMTAGDKYKRKYTRTEALRVLIRDALDTRR
jgi:hypothetical protein